MIEPGDILRDTTPHPVAGLEGRYETVIPDAWRILYAFGGATMAASMRAAEAAVDRDDLHIVSVDSIFCAAVPCGPVAMQAEVLRQGRSGAQALVRLWALDPEDPDPRGEVRSDLVVMCVFGGDAEQPFAFTGSPAPQVRDPEECEAREIEPDSVFATMPYHHQTEFRLTESWDWRDRSGPGEPTTSSWFRFCVPPLRPDGTWEPAALALPGDILGPAVHSAVGSKAGGFLVVSLQIGMQFIAPAVGEWVLQHTHAHSAGNGYAAGTAILYDRHRTLVAVATQTAKLQPLRQP